jgi:hypothetical protein
MNEVTVIFTAAERHPKNYHAWTYARFITLFLYDHDPAMKYMLPVVFARVKSWCGMNPSDISGWMFFLWFCGQQRPWQMDLRGGGVMGKEPREMVGEVVEGMMRVSPGHEAQWAFVRGAVIGMEGVMRRGEGGVVLEKVGEYLKLLEGKQGLTKEEERDKMFVERYFKDSGKREMSWYRVMEAHVKEA